MATLSERISDVKTKAKVFRGSSGARSRGAALNQLYDSIEKLSDEADRHRLLEAERILETNLKLNRDTPFAEVAEKLEALREAYKEVRKEYFELRGPVKAPPKDLGDLSGDKHKYPEHAKLPDAEYRAAIGRVLQWLSDGDFHLCKWHDYSKNGGSGGVWRKATGFNVNNIVAKAHGADPHKLEEERREMLSELNAQQD